MWVPRHIRRTPGRCCIPGFAAWAWRRSSTRGADRCARADGVDESLSEQDGAVATHRDTDRADLVRGRTEAESLAHRNDLVDHHSHRVIAGVWVPVEVAAVSRNERDRRQTRFRQAPWPGEVLLARWCGCRRQHAGTAQAEAGCLWSAQAGRRSCTRHNACVPGVEAAGDRLAGPAKHPRWRRTLQAPSTASRMCLPGSTP